MTELCDLARKYGSDKAAYYTPFYYELFNPIRDKVTRVLELGIGYPELMLDYTKKHGMDYYFTGASLLMWRDFFPNAEIYGLDVQIDLALNALDREPRIHCEFVDERRAETFDGIEDKIGKDFDIIIEDGLHEPWAQMLALDRLMPILAPNGIYIMEDIMEYVDMTKSVPYPCQMKEFGPARVMVVRNPKL